MYGSSWPEPIAALLLSRPPATAKQRPSSPCSWTICLSLNAGFIQNGRQRFVFLFYFISFTSSHIAMGNHCHSTGLSPCHDDFYHIFSSSSSCPTVCHGSAHILARKLLFTPSTPQPQAQNGGGLFLVASCSVSAQFGACISVSPVVCLLHVPLE